MMALTDQMMKWISLNGNVWSSTSKHARHWMQKKKLYYYVLLSNLAGTPAKFFRTIVIDTNRVIQVTNTAPSETKKQ